ncbi:MAG: class I SAM-dependent methyltransferase [Bacteroidota bacterium]
MFNTAFDPAHMEYSPAYENSLHFSAVFRTYAEELADALIRRHDLRNKHVIDIGCGKGDFLLLLCERGDNRGTGFDPSYVPELHGHVESDRMRVVREFYSAAHREYRADLVTCRHVLEHIHRPRAFLQTVRDAIGDRMRTAVYFEVPNVLYTLRDRGIWDLIYEHCSYFSASSLLSAFRAAGFRPVEAAEAFGGQYLGLHAFPGKDEPGKPPAADNDTERMHPYVEKFGEEYTRKVAFWRDYLDQAGASGARVVVWGGGSKGVTFLNTLGAREVEFMVDINPRKHGLFVPGTGQEVIPPGRLAAQKPDAVIVMNPLYAGEIKALLKEMGLGPEVLVA